MIKIGDTKIRSPFITGPTKHLWRDRLELAIEYADMIAVQTHGNWAGSHNLVKLAKEATDKPILAKGIHWKDKEIDDLLYLGADYVLVVGRIPPSRFLDRCMLEPTCLKEIEDYPRGVKVVWNARNIVNGWPKKETFQEAREKWDGWLCQASMIKRREDIHPSADAIMIGECLELLREI